MRESQYVEAYLDAAERRGWTPQTYLRYELRGRARTYSVHYLRALQHAINRRLNDGSVVRTESVGGSIAYVRRAS